MTISSHRYELVLSYPFARNSKGVYFFTNLLINANKTLIINDIKGEFTGMLKNRKFEIVLVKENSGVGIEISTASKAVNYSGKIGCQ